jgi:hypothetical protein
MNNNSFTYVINSYDRINTAPNQLEYDINFGGFNLPYENYFVEVMNCVIDPITVDPAIGYIFLTCANLHDNGIFCNQSLTANECIMSIIPTTGDEKIAKGGIIFNAFNIRMQRQVKFRMLAPNFQPLTGTDININFETSWVLTLRLTPIIN